jgi:hypothetical protein
MRPVLNSLRRLISRRRGGPAGKAELTTAPRFAAVLPARLLLNITPQGSPGRRLIASTVNVSETGLAIALPEQETQGRRVSAGDRLDVELDIYPAGVIGLTCEVVWQGRFEAGRTTGHVVGVKITGMSQDDRARFLEYLATHGWERAAGYQKT